MKEPLVSVIVPTRNSKETIEECLYSIKNQSYKNIEIIVVDNNSSDKTKEIAKKYTDKVFNKGPERSAQRNFGANKSYGEYLLIVDSDMELSNEVIKESVDMCESNRNILGLVIPEESFGSGFWTECKKLERSFYLGVAWMEAARFFEKKTFLAIGGYDFSNTGTEDIDLPQRLQQKYGIDCISRINSFILHNEGNLSLTKTLKKKFYYGKKLDSYRKVEVNSQALRQQSSPISRYKLFFLKPKKLFQNPIIGISMIFMKTLELIAGGLGFVTTKYNLYEKFKI